MNEIWNTRNHSEINRMIARIPAVSGRFYWSEWNYRIPRNMNYKNGIRVVGNQYF